MLHRRMIQQFFYNLNLIDRQQFGMVFVHTNTVSYLFGDIFFITREHDKTIYPRLFQHLNSFYSILFHQIRHQNMSGIFTINNHMYFGSNLVYTPFTSIGLNTHIVEHLTITHTYLFTINASTNTMPSHFLDFRNLTIIILMSIS